MDLALNDLQRLICHNNKPTHPTNKSRMSLILIYKSIHLITADIYLAKFSFAWGQKYGAQSENRTR